VALSGGVVGRVPVKTDGALLKELIPSLLEELYAMKIQAPVKQGHYLIENYRDTGVSLVTTRTIPAAG
jgi:CxxC motif-containing protein